MQPSGYMTTSIESSWRALAGVTRQIFRDSIPLVLVDVPGAPR